MSNVLDVVTHQLSALFLLDEKEKMIVSEIIDEAERRSIVSLGAFYCKYFSGDVKAYNSVMYCVFLYWLSKVANDYAHDTELPDKIYYLNKVMNSVDIYYEVELPEHWACEHPVGAVIGRARYGDHFSFTQGCTVGGNWKDGELKYPIIGNNCMMLSNSKIVGDSHIGNNVIMSANSYVINTDIPDNSIVFGQGKDIIIKQKKENYRPE